MTDSRSGKVTLDGDILAFSSSECFPSWTLCIRDVAAIGEYTTAEGPYVPDFFSVLVDRAERWYLLPIEAEGYFETFPAVEELLGLFKEGLRGLAGTTDTDSVVHWPAALANQPLFRFIPLPKPLWARVLFMSPEFKIELSDAVREYLASLPQN